MALADVAEVLTRDRLPLARELVAGTAMPDDAPSQGDDGEVEETNLVDLAAWIDKSNRVIQ